MTVSVLGPHGVPKPPYGSFAGRGATLPQIITTCFPEIISLGYAYVAPATGRKNVLLDLGLLLGADRAATASVALDWEPGFPFADPAPASRLIGSPQIVDSKLSGIFSQPYGPANQAVQQTIDSLIATTIYRMSVNVLSTAGIPYQLRYWLVCMPLS